MVLFTYEWWGCLYTFAAICSNCLLQKCTCSFLFEYLTKGTYLKINHNLTEARVSKCGQTVLLGPPSVHNCESLAKVNLTSLLILGRALGNKNTMYTVYFLSYADNISGEQVDSHTVMDTDT